MIEFYVWFLIVVEGGGEVVDVEGVVMVVFLDFLGLESLDCFVVFRVDGVVDVGEEVV